MEAFDLIIVGAGVVGLSAALSLAKKTSLNIALIDAKPITSNWQTGQIDFRISAISPASKKFFESLNVWSRIQAKRCSPYHKMHVWDEDSEAQLDFDCEKIHAHQLGFIVEDSAIRASLLEEMEQQENITLYPAVKLIDVKEREQIVDLILEDNVLQSKLVIAADGANSWLRNKLGIKVASHAYEHDAIVANVHTVLEHEHVASQRFLKKGPLAFLPLSERNLSSIVWSMPPQDAKRILELSDEEFKKELTHAFESKLGNVLSVSKRYSFPLQMQHAKNYVKSKFVLVGDAAHTIHPLAGQGVNLGLLDVAKLTNIIVKAIKKNKDFTSHLALRQYERARKADNASMISFVGLLKNIFSTDSSSIKTIRTFGIKLTNNSEFIKKLFMKHAMGEHLDMDC